MQNIKVPIGDIVMNFIWKRVKSLWKTFSRVFRKSGEGVFISKENAERRLDACRKCDLYNQKTGMCDICGCVMSVKVKFKAARCALEDEGGESRWPN